MDEVMRNKVLIIAVGLSLVLFIIAVVSCSEAAKQRLYRNKEMSSRYDAEEKLNKFMQEKQNAEKNISALTKELEEAKGKLETAGKTLLQEQMVNRGLKEELDKVVKQKTKLEEELTAELSKSKPVAVKDKK